MAYSTAGERRVNYYSSPDVNFNGIPSGTTKNDNARTLTEVRFAAAHVGDESMACPSTIPTTQAVECKDNFKNCPTLSSASCWHETMKSSCPSSCGLCPGMTPHISNTCYNKYSNCEQLAELGFCGNEKAKAGCPKACGGCV